MKDGNSRRRFLKQTGILTAGAVIIPKSLTFESPESSASLPSVLDTPIVISTWDHGLAANETAYKILSAGGKSLDAVEKGVNVSENDPAVQSVGFGGLPDASGIVTLDACIMDEFGNAGAVGFVQNFKNPVSIARKVMEITPHVFLVGSGAEEFAAAHGFTKSELLTPEAKAEWLKWNENKPKKSEGHDTIGMIAIDKFGNLAGACTTSGLAFKLHGRVGDSPIIGAGLYVDNEVGGAAATGVGEECIKVCGSFLAVEYMRRGASPEEACLETIKRVAKRHKNRPSFQLAFIALNKSGKFGSSALNPGFEFALACRDKNILIKSESLYK